MWYYLRWRLIRFLCGRLFLKYSEQPVLQEWGDPVETFKETHVHRDLGRFVTYVVWLKQFPLAAQWYFRIEEQFGSQVLSCLELIGYWIQWGKTSWRYCAFAKSNFVRARIQLPSCLAVPSPENKRHHAEKIHQRDTVQTLHVPSTSQQQRWTSLLKLRERRGGSGTLFFLPKNY